MSYINKLEDSNFSHHIEIETRVAAERIQFLQNQLLNANNYLAYWRTVVTENNNHKAELINQGKTQTQDYHIVVSRAERAEKLVTEYKLKRDNLQIQINQLNR